jgi:hypothetical protein
MSTTLPETVGAAPAAAALAQAPRRDVHEDGGTFAESHKMREIKCPSTETRSGQLPVRLPDAPHCEPPIEARIIDEALKILGPNGKKWIPGRCIRRITSQNGHF